jgi:hypothetical protein
MKDFIMSQCERLPKREGEIVKKVLSSETTLKHIKETMLKLSVFPLSRKEIIKNMELQSDLSQWIMTEAMLRCISKEEEGEKSYN